MTVNEVLETMGDEATAIVMTIGGDGYFICAYKKDLINDKYFKEKVRDRTVTHLAVTRTRIGFGIAIQCSIDNEENKDALEKALDKACEYTHDSALNGCPFNYDISAITNKKMNECNICDYQCMSLDDINSSKQQNNEYLKKSIKCWKEYFLRGDTENDEN